MSHRRAGRPSKNNGKTLSPRPSPSPSPATATSRELADRPSSIEIPAEPNSSPPLAVVDWETFQEPVEPVIPLQVGSNDASFAPPQNESTVSMRIPVGSISLSPSQRKQLRPGTILTVLCAPTQETAIAQIILSETTAFGLRIETVRRKTLRRQIIQADTPFGPIAVKLGFLGERLVQASPEYESCKAAALRLNTPLRTIQDAARTAALEAEPSQHTPRSSTQP